MAYVVGSASVEIVPDFRNAQVSITRWFESKPNTYKIPVELDIKEGDSKRAEQQAERAGSRISEAMNRGAAKNDAAGIRAAQKLANERTKMLNTAHAEALRMQAQMDRDAARERQQTDRDMARLQQATMRETQRVIEQEAAESSRRRIASFKEEERAFQQSLKSQVAALKEMQREASSQEKIRLQVEIDERQAALEGRQAGGIVTRAIQREMRQSAGLIIGAIAAALAIGAPVAIGAAVALFAGVGAVAAFQSERLRATWIGLWDEIKAGAVSDAAILVPTFDRMAGAIGQAFQRMRPFMRDAFEAVGPQIDSLTASLIRMGENALPGITRALQNAMPAVRGFGDFFESTGTGVGAFFERLASHAPAAGSAMAELGSTLQSLLPALAEILGQGAELASLVLPVMTAGFRGLLGVLDAVGGALPMVMSGFLAFRALQGLGRFVNGWSISLANAAANGGMFTARMQGASSVLARVGNALPGVGIGVGALAAVMARGEQQANDYAQAMVSGGAAAKKAMQDAAQGSIIEGLTANMGGLGRIVELWTTSSEEAAEAQRELYASMTPLERAQSDLSAATRELEEAMADENTTAGELEGAKRKVAEAAARQAAEEDKLARATEGVTEAMAAQADAARARVDADFGYQQAVMDVAEAQLKYQETLKDTEASALDVEKALLDLNEAYAEQVTKAGDLAMSNLPAAMTDNQKAIIGAKAALDELNALIAQGIELPPSMEQYRQSLMGIVNQAGGATLAQAQLAAALGEIGVAVESVPDSKAVVITAPTDEILARLDELGFDITNLPEGKVKVEPKTDEAAAALGNLSGLLTGLGTQVATPQADLNADQFNAGYQDAIDKATNLANQTPTPQARMNADQFNAVNDAALLAANNLAGQRPTPIANMEEGPLNSIFSLVMDKVRTVAGQRPTPTVTAIDNASGIIGSIIGGLSGIRDKTVTVTTVMRTVNQSVPGSSVRSTLADGGAPLDAPVRRYDVGGEVIGRGGPRDDLVHAMVSPGEHIFDARDVALMGGQAGVYAFREMLNAGQFRSPGKDAGVRQMVAAGAPRVPTPAPQGNREVTILTYDNPRAILRAVKADEQQTAALATPWP